MTDVGHEERGVIASLHKQFHHSVAQKTLVIALELVVLWAALASPWADDAAGDQLWLSLGLGALAIINFIVFFQADEGPDGAVGESRGAAMRRAIAGAAVVTYLLLVAIVAFNPELQQVAGADGACEPLTGDETGATCVALTRDLINRLGVVVITVVGFYFGSSTLDKYLGELRGKRSGAAPDAAGQPEAEATESQ
jgi:hypothetical protein